MSEPTETVTEQLRDRTFAGRDGQPFPSHGNVTYTVRVDQLGVVWLDYSDGRKVDALVSARKVLRLAAKGIWKEVTHVED